MRTPIDECMETAILVACDDDRSFADIARPEIAAATARENAEFAQLLGGQANAQALADFTGRRG